MIFRSSWVSKRIPTALILLPILWLTLLISPNLNEWRSLWVLVIVNFLMTGAINSYTEYYDLLKVKQYGFTSKQKFSFLIYVSILLFVFAIILAFYKVSLLFSVLVLLYGLVMLTYNHPSVDWKQNAISAWIITSFFQGIFLGVLYYVGISKLPLDNVITSKVLIPAVIVSIIIGAFFPFSYSQSKSLEGFGDRRFISIQVALFIVGSLLAIWYFITFLSSTYLNLVFMLIAFGLIYLFRKYRAVLLTKVSIPRQRRRFFWSNWIAVISLNAFFFWLFLDYTQLIQLLQMII